MELDVGNGIIVFDIRIGGTHDAEEVIIFAVEFSISGSETGGVLVREIGSVAGDVFDADDGGFEIGDRRARSDD